MPIPAYAMAPFGSLNTAKFQIPDLVLLQRDKFFQPWGAWSNIYVYIYIHTHIYIYIYRSKTNGDTYNKNKHCSEFIYAWMQVHMFAMQDLHKQLQCDFGSPCSVIVYLHSSCNFYMYGWSHLNSKPHQWPITGSLQRLVHHIDQKWPRVRVQNGIPSVLDIVASRLSLYQDRQSHPQKMNGPSIAYKYNWNNTNTKSLLRIMLGTFELLYEGSFNKCWGNCLTRCIKHQQVFPATFF